MNATYRLQQYLFRALLALAIALGINTAFGQSTIPHRDQYDVVSMYGIEKHGNGQYTEISEYQDWRTKWPYFYERQRFLGWPDAQIARATPWCASMNDLAWGTSPNGVRMPNISYATIFVGHGQWASNMEVDWVYGRIIGAGVSNVYPGAAYPRGAGGTEVLMFPDRWIVDGKCKVKLAELGAQDNNVMAAFRSVTFNAEGTVGAYHERAGLDQIHINGQAGRRWVAGRLVVGFVAWDLGTGSKLGNVYGNSLDVLMLATRGTPGQIDKLTGMGGNIALVMLLGAVDAPYEFTAIECDDFPTVFMTRAQWGRESGARIGWRQIKIETGVTSESRNSWVGNTLADLKGRHVIDGGLVNFAEANINVSDLIVIDDQHANGSQPNLIKFVLGKWNTEANLIHEVGGNVYPTPGGFPWDGQEVIYYRSGGYRKVEVNRVDLMPLPGVVGWRSRLGFQRWDGTAWAPAISHATGSPSFSYQNASGSGTVTTPPSSPCTYTYSAWGACVNGTQTRTVTGASPAGCAGTPVLSQACSTATSKLVWASTFAGTSTTVITATTGANITASAPWSGWTAAPNGTGSTSGNTSFPWTGTASKVVLVGVTFTNAPAAGAYFRITANHYIHPDGRVFYTNAGKDIFTGATVTKGQRIPRLELPVNDGVLGTLIGGAVGTGSTPNMTVEAAEVYQ